MALNEPVLDDPIAWPLAEALAQCLCSMLEAEAPVRCCCVLPGAEVAWDDCSCDGTRGGMAWVRIVNDYPTARFPQPYTGKSQPCGGAYDGWAGALDLGVLRCAPTVDARGRLPSCEQQHTAARRAAADKHIMRRAVSCCGWAEDRQIIEHGWQALGPEGGCHGGVLTVTVNQHACVCNG